MTAAPQTCKFGRATEPVLSSPAYTFNWIWNTVIFLSLTRPHVIYLVLFLPNLIRKRDPKMENERFDGMEIGLTIQGQAYEYRQNSSQHHRNWSVLFEHHFIQAVWLTRFTLFNPNILYLQVNIPIVNIYSALGTPADLRRFYTSENSLLQNPVKLALHFGTNENDQHSWGDQKMIKGATFAEIEKRIQSWFWMTIA